MMVERMIVKGMFERYPNLRLCLSHGGGLLPFNIWRLDHSYSLRAELRKIVPRKPSEYLKKMYFDSIVHSAAALQYLVRVAGADRVVIGTDYPMAMGDFDTVTKIMAIEATAAEREQILGGNAALALNL
jgi:aminocarboxymuconate-semialdehyde decarboxylase